MIRRNELQHVFQNLVLGLGNADPVGDLLEKPGRRVHLADEVTHSRESRRVRLDHDVKTGIHEVQVVIGDDDSNLDEFVGFQVETGHFAVNPYQPVTAVCHGSILAARTDRPPRLGRYVDWVRYCSHALQPGSQPTVR